MANAPHDLPGDIEALKALLVAKDNHIALLEEKLRLASLKQFGTSSEKANDDQLGLFNEAEEILSKATTQVPADAEGIVVANTRARHQGASHCRIICRARASSMISPKRIRCEAVVAVKPKSAKRSLNNSTSFLPGSRSCSTCVSSTLVARAKERTMMDQR